tara:strand:- start:1000 stop:1404 length:405 start_codon:yes stop_codon:yes gene_type:complete
MNNILKFGIIILGMTASAQKITDKKGYSINVTDYEQIEIMKSTNMLVGVKVIGDGYDEIVIGKGSQIDDGKRVITDKVTDFAKKDAFWKSFMKRHGFSLLDAVKATKKKTNSAAKYLPGANAKETVLTFVKLEL